LSTPPTRFRSISSTRSRPTAPRTPPPVPDALYTLDIGGNDIANGLIALSKGAITHGDLNKVLSKAVANTIAGITDLYDDGARDLLLYNVPKPSLTPALNTSPAAVKTLADTLAQGFNGAVLSGLTSLGGLKVFVLDSYGMIDDIVSNPGVFPFSNVTDSCVATPSCVGGTLAEQNEFLFWDDAHPTAAAHLLTADLAQALVAPEPSTWAMMLLGFAGLGFVGYRAARKTATASLPT
jgi:phospholipase/lecithinase/hemolysin